MRGDADSNERGSGVGRGVGRRVRGGGVTPRLSNYSRLFSQVYILSGVILTIFYNCFLSIRTFV